MSLCFYFSFPCFFPPPFDLDQELGKFCLCKLCWNFKIRFVGQLCLLALVYVVHAWCMSFYLFCGEMYLQINFCIFFFMFLHRNWDVSYPPADLGDRLRCSFLGIKVWHFMHYSLVIKLEDHLFGLEGALEKVSIAVILCCLEILAIKAVVTLEFWWFLIPLQPFCIFTPLSL